MENKKVKSFLEHQEILNESIVTDLPNLKGQTIKAVTFRNGMLIVITEEGYELSITGTEHHTTYVQVNDEIGNVSHETQKF